MDMDTIGVIAVLLLVVSSAALIAKNKKKKMEMIKNKFTGIKSRCSNEVLDRIFRYFMRTKRAERWIV